GRDDQGDPKGTATLPDGTKWTAYFYHEAAKNTTWLDILDGRGSMVYCAFTAWQVQIPELGLVTVSLTGRDDQGDPKGTATLPDGTKWTAYFYHEAAKNTT
ncbi:hypothetical protein CTI14_60390, partial [Methylobacterium radiotolerans]